MSSTEAAKRNAIELRDRKREAGVCINGPLPDGKRLSAVEHGAPIRGGKCQRCIDMHAAKITQRRIRPTDTHCPNGHSMSGSNVAHRRRLGLTIRRCLACQRDATSRYRGTCAYTPLDVILNTSNNRVLRALRWFDWVEVPDLMEAVEAPEHECLERSSVTKAISRMVSTGDLERRATVMGSTKGWRGSMSEVRITDKGRARLAKAIASYYEQLGSVTLSDEELEAA